MQGISVNQNNDEKVVLPKEVAEAMTFYKGAIGETLLFNLSELVARARNPHNEHARHIMSFVNSSFKNRKKYFEALIKDWKFVIPPKDQAEEAYKKAAADFANSSYSSQLEAESRGKMEGMRIIKNIYDLDFEIV